MQKEKQQLLHISFNQDYSFFSIGSEKGFKVYKLGKDITQSISRQFGAGIGIIQMVHKTNIFAMVGGGKTPRYPKNKAMIWDDCTYFFNYLGQMKCIVETNCKSEIKSIKMKPDRCIIALETKNFVFNLSDFALLESFQTCPNPKGLCTIAALTDQLILSFPSKNIGYVQIFNQKLSQKKSINAHKSTLCALQLCPNGYKLATASQKGTIIRIFDIKTSECLQQLRRGSEYATIFSIAFDLKSSMLACSSDSGTIHVFALKASKQQGQNESQVKNKKSKFSILSKWSSYFDYEWSFATYRTAQKRTKVGFMNNCTLAVVSTTGVVDIVQYDLEKGGQCKKISQFNLVQ